MRVTHVITRLIIGGAQENTIASVLGLQKKAGLEVRLISGPTTGPEGSLESLVSGNTQQFTLLPSLVRPVHPCLDWRALKALTQIFCQERPDIVHTHSGKAGILGRLAAHRAKVRCIVHTIHGPSFGPFQGKFANYLFTRAEQYAGRVTTHFVSVAQAMTQQYLQAGIGRPEQFTFIPSGFDLGPFLHARNDPAVRKRFGLEPNDFVIGKIARLVPLKGHHDLLASAAPIVAKCPRAKFLLVGDGPLRSELQTAAEQAGLAKHFCFAGLLPPPEVPAAIGIMDVLVHLSRREGLPRALPQALAGGKPVIAADCDGAGEVCIPGKTGFLVSPDDTSSLTQALLHLADSPPLRLRLGTAGRELVCRIFPTERMVDALHALYVNLLAQQHGT